MSPRLKRLRKVLDVPIIKGFKPYGHDAAKINKKPITILYEEYEALRLCDYNMDNHSKASEIMQVSRPTFTRIYASARKKLASAFVEGRQIVIEGGKVYFDSNWHSCHSCACTFNNPEKEITIINCPLCGSNHISDYDNEAKIDDDKTCNNIYLCPDCGSSIEDESDNEYYLCKKCNVTMNKRDSKICNN